ncbi:acyltransferase [Cryobacterium sp. PH31-L1]|uniref:acyltransferase family protein n=1 Tax=Cryobacterium sp. PH31-L1 TaxID=3046199 RepID=UPI0024BB644F|nr:acyltransferase [Cryobacterium sp. PH31-L1]MDJ0376961.1 acyltransferase [Cryobacterium sp. PH31-L1]
MQPIGSIRLDSLTGLRAFAALAVFLHHAATWQASPDWFGHITDAGNQGVSFFFMLSGFVLAWSLRGDDSVGRFYRRRGARILPLYWIAWSIGAAYEIVLNESRLLDILPSLFLVQTWSPQERIYFAGNSVGWSLSAEAFFYLMFPLLVILLGKLSPRWLSAILVLSVVVVILIPIMLHPDSTEGADYYLTYVFPGTRLFEFIAGVTLGFMFRRGVRTSIPTWGAVAVAVAVSISSNWLPIWAYLVAASIVPFLLLLAAAAASDLHAKRTFFGRKRLVILGEWSYAFYLIHLIVLRVVIGLNTRTVGAPWWLTTLVALAISIVTAAVLCEFVEKPIEKKMRGRRQKVAPIQQDAMA